MPAPLIKSFAQKTGKSQDAVEKLWSKAKAIAKEEGHNKDYAYIVGILKKMLGLNESVTFKEFLKIKNIKELN